jgi:hypothetical protein
MLGHLVEATLRRCLVEATLLGHVIRRLVKATLIGHLITTRRFVEATLLRRLSRRLAGVRFAK